MEKKPISEFALFIVVFVITILAIAFVTVISFNAGVLHGIEVSKRIK
ncbi:hypothetical protein [uncultured Chryseobacterium sp.]|nr:hypothetical protein [uncultured Chryseobacterium sp.]